jgi:hypothetical protein
MEETTRFIAQLRVPYEPWHRRPRTWMLAAITILPVALVASRSAGAVLLGVAGLCALVSAVLTVRSLRAARAEMVGMIDAHLEARAAQQRPDSEEDARARAELQAIRQRLSR